MQKLPDRCRGGLRHFASVFKSSKAHNLSLSRVTGTLFCQRLSVRFSGVLPDSHILIPDRKVAVVFSNSVAPLDGNGEQSAFEPRCHVY
jgi:hypothetical protein